MTSSLKDFSDAIAGVVEAAGSSVVRVDGRERLPASGIVWSEDGVVVTASHVLERDEEIAVGLPDGGETDATLIGRDPTTDLAAVRVSGDGLAAPGLAEPDGARVGNLALAVGRPGRTAQAALGIVSALGDAWDTRAGGRIDRHLQSDVVMYPGFSGGPLVDASGHVLGLNTSALSRGVTVSVPVPTIRRVVETLLEHGRVRRGFLGIGAQAVRLPDDIEAELGQETGLILVSVDRDGPAERGGLAVGDIVVSADGKPVRHLDDLLGLLGGDSVERSIQVRVARGGRLQENAVVVGERSPDREHKGWPFPKGGGPWGRGGRRGPGHGHRGWRGMGPHG